MPQFVCTSCSRPVGQEDPACPSCGHKREKVGWVKDPFIGRVIGSKYRIETRLGAGGMGAVFLATHSFGDTDLGQVVIKFLLDEYAADPERRARFVKEARAARELSSPHVVKVFDFGEDEDGTPYLVMEHIEGKSLFHVLLVNRLLPVRRALNIAMQVAEAMVECHDKGILHRDLKPDNLLLVDSRGGDFVKIVDFGIARVPTERVVGPQAQSMVSSLVIGTPRYMAPEQILNQPIDHRIDIFALGVILYEMMCGCSPIVLKPGENEMAYIALNISEPPRKVSDVLLGVPPELDALLDRMMAKNPEDRPARMSDVLMALEEVSKLPQLQAEEPGGPPSKEQQVVAAQLFAPLPSAAQRVRLQLSSTLSALRGRGRYVVPALLGAIAGLLLLVLWLLTASHRDPSAQMVVTTGPPLTPMSQLPLYPPDGGAAIQPQAPQMPAPAEPPSAPSVSEVAEARERGEIEAPQRPRKRHKEARRHRKKR